MVFDGPGCLHFGDCRKQTLGESLCMSKDVANQKNDDERRRLTGVVRVRSFKCSHEASCLSSRPRSLPGTEILTNETRRTSESAVAGGPKVVRKETRSLSPDGKTMTVESVRGSNPALVMVFDKK